MKRYNVYEIWLNEDISPLRKFVIGNGFDDAYKRIDKSLIPYINGIEYLGEMDLHDDDLQSVNNKKSAE